MATNNPISEIPEVYKDGKILVKSLNIRRTPNKDSPVVFILNQGTPFRFGKTNDPDWVVIASATTKIAGFAMSKFVTELEVDSS